MEYKELLEKVIPECEGLPNLIVSEVRESACTKPGDNFMSAVNTVEVIGRIAGGGEYKSRLFIKRPPVNPETKGVYSVDEAFNNEAIMYLRVLPLYDVTVASARCYHASDDVIILQDLFSEGFRLADRRQGFDIPTVSQVLKVLSRFHAASHHARITKKEDFEKAESLLKVFGFVLSSQRDLGETCLRRAIQEMEGVPDLEDVVSTLRTLQGKVCDVLRKLRVPGKVEVLGHGDFWINNIMIRKNSEDLVRIVDFQACCKVSPAVDVWTLLYSSLPTPFTETVDQLLNIYCSSFIDNLTSLKVPPKQIPPKAEIMKELESKEFYGFLVATFYLPALDMSFDLIPDFDKVSEEQVLNDDFMKQFYGGKFKERMCSLARLCKARGVFSQ